MKFHRAAAIGLLAVTGACSGQIQMPQAPGGGASDLRSNFDRETWVAENPSTPENIKAALLEGVFVEGMTIEHRDVLTNPDRRGTTSNGFWRNRNLGDEVRYQWFVSAERLPFVDARGRGVCELVYRDDVLHDVRYCDAGGG